MAREASVLLLRSMAEGVGRAVAGYLSRIQSQSEREMGHCLCYFSPEIFVLDANLQGHNIWFETPEIMGCRWGALSCPAAVAYDDAARGVQLVFARFSGGDEVHVFAGAWGIPSSIGYWKDRRLSQADLLLANDDHRCVLSAWARKIDTTGELSCLASCSHSTGGRVRSEAPSVLAANFEARLGGQFTTMLFAANSICGKDKEPVLGHLPSPRVSAGHMALRKLPLN